MTISTDMLFPLKWKERSDLAFLTPLVMKVLIWFSSRFRQLRSRCWRVRDVFTSFWSLSLNFSIICPFNPLYSKGTALLPLIFRYRSWLPCSWQRTSRIWPRSYPMIPLWERSRCFMWGRFCNASERPCAVSFENIDTLLRTRVFKH